MGVGIAIRKEAVATHDNYVQYYKRQRRLSFELGCPNCDVVYIVYCEPGVREESARKHFVEEIWNGHPHHSEVIAIGDDAVA